MGAFSFNYVLFQLTFVVSSIPQQKNMFFPNSLSLTSCVTFFSKALVGGYGFVRHGGLRSAHLYCRRQSANVFPLALKLKLYTRNN